VSLLAHLYPGQRLQYPDSGAAILFAEPSACHPIALLRDVGEQEGDPMLLSTSGLDFLILEGDVYRSATYRRIEHPHPSDRYLPA
jgi:hypothetical protein